MQTDKMQASLRDMDLLLETDVRAALREVFDPEIPALSVSDLGMIQSVHCDNGEVRIEMTPTFVGCPALNIIQRNVEGRISKVDGVRTVSVKFVFDEAWTTERISAEGRQKLKEFGIAPPSCSLRSMKRLHADCPYCGSADTRLENAFGPTACRSVFYCNACKQPFESMKPV